MSMAGEGVFGPEVLAVASEAFGRSWRFIERDPLLAGHDRAALQAELARRILNLAQDGERDTLRIANRAIGGMREKMRGAMSA
jgi:hypothetical protein